MGRVLKKDFLLDTPILPLHDRPAPHFHFLESRARSTFLSALADTRTHAEGILRGTTRLIVSSTSWTPDEDFSILIQALKRYSELALTSHPHLPEILTIITGKGPQRKAYMQQIDDLRSNGELEMVTVKSAWLSVQDYASLLASADLGVSLHTSSSGVDLPMKVVDMFGAGLPVIGWSSFEAWPELVVEGVNGKGFKDAGGLLDNLIHLFGEDGRLLQDLKEGAVMESKRKWDDEWDPVAGKLFELTY